MINQILHGDCRDILKRMQPNSVHAVVTDPPYGIKFMGKDWDGAVAFQPDTWREVLRVMKPGAYLLAFGGSRTAHRMTCAIEDAGFEIRDCIMWLYGQGFPKSHNLKDEWAGWGTALKPAYEPIILARKPLDGTVVANTLRHGCGGLNIDACLIPAADGVPQFNKRNEPSSNTFGDGLNGSNRTGVVATGRWPANVAHDGSDEVEAAFAAFGERASTETNANGRSYASAAETDGALFGHRKQGPLYGDTGTASRFFYCGKATPQDRAGSKHPTVKPIKLMQWLVRMVTPPGGTVLDPFCGSGTTLQAATELGFNFIGIDQSKEYFNDTHHRLSRNKNESAMISCCVCGNEVIAIAPGTEGGDDAVAWCLEHWPYHQQRMNSNERSETGAGATSLPRDVNDVVRRESYRRDQELTRIHIGSLSYTNPKRRVSRSRNARTNTSRMEPGGL